MGMDAIHAAEIEADKLNQLYRQHVPRVRALAYLLTGNEADADDLVHEAFIRASGRFAHLTRPANFGAYLRRTLINLHINRLRRLRLERRYLGWLRRQPEVSEALPNFEAIDELVRALRRLPTRQRAALLLRYGEDMSEAQVAEIMGCSGAAVRNLISRGLRQLREEIGGEPG